MECWVEHYSELYTKENIVTEDPLNTIEYLPVPVELDDRPLTNLARPWTPLPPAKPPGKEGVPARSRSAARVQQITELHETLCQCWREGEVPEDMRDANIITLHKNKGNRSDWNNYNYHGISLLSIIGKLFARTTLKRLYVLADRVYPESQYGFQATGQPST